MSQFRENPVSGEWVVIAPARAKRPGENGKKDEAKKACPFDDPEHSGNWPPILEYEDGGKWRAIIVPNKFPVVKHMSDCPIVIDRGNFRWVGGIGYHELLITRNHKNDFPKLSPEDAYVVFQMFAERYRAIDRDRCMKYLSVFANWGPEAGASQKHPHYQLLALPVLPPHVARSLEGSRRYFAAHRRCVHCDMVKAELKAKERIVAENKEAVAIAPFASSSPYEIRIFPKRHFSAFEHTPDAVLRGAAELLQKVLGRVKTKLHEPDYNFLIHSSPIVGEEKYRHYHWHIEIHPKISHLGGLELSTSIYVNSVDPAEAARILR